MTIGRWTTRNGTETDEPDEDGCAATAMPRLVAMVDTQGVRPPRIMPIGSRCSK